MNLMKVILELRFVICCSQFSDSLPTINWFALSILTDFSSELLIYIWLSSQESHLIVLHGTVFQDPVFKRKSLKCWWECKLVQPLCMENSMEDLKKYKTRTTIQSSNSTSGYLFKENKNTNLKRYMNPYVNCSHQFTTARIWKQAKCPCIGEWIKKMWYAYICMSI